MTKHKEELKKRAETFRAFSRMLDDDSIQVSDNRLFKLVCDSLAEIADILAEIVEED